MKNLNVLALLLLFIASSCNLVDNREQQAREKITDKVLTESKGAIQVVDFKKIDGVEGDLYGVKTYAMTCAVTIQMTRDCYIWVEPRIGMYNHFDVDDTWANSEYHHWLHNGAKIKLTETANFEKHESGWILKYMTYDRSEPL